MTIPTALPAELDPADGRPTTASGSVLAASALFAGIALLMLGTGLQQSLLGVRATLAGFHTTVTGVILSAYYLGFLVGSVTAPGLIRRVGHVRVFAALASTASAAVLVHAVFVEPVTWGLVRLVSGMCMAGVFVVAESWLNAMATNETRGRLLSVYMIVVLAGMGGGQLLLNVAPARGFRLFVLASVLVSVAVVPVSLTRQSSPHAREPARVSLRDVWLAAPLGIVGSAGSGMLIGALLGFGAVYARLAGLSLSQISLFMAASIFGGALLQFPVGRLSDRVDRRRVIVATCAGGAVAAGAAAMAGRSSNIVALVLLVGLLGGLALPLYSLCVAHTNDYLAPDQIVGASSQLVLANGAGAVAGPFAASAAITLAGPHGFFWLLLLVEVAVGTYAAYRLLRREPVPVEEQTPYAPVPPTATTLASGLNPIVRDPGEVTATRVLLADGSALHVRSQGDGEPVLLLHDAGTSSRTFADLLPELAAVGYRPIVPDLPGHGRSDRATELSASAVVDDLLVLLDALAADPVDVVGVGAGASLAALLALLAPDRARTVTLVGDLRGILAPSTAASGRRRGSVPAGRHRPAWSTSGEGPRSQRRARRFARRHYDPSAAPERYALLVGDMIAADPGAVEAARAWPAAVIAAGGLEAIEVPLLAVVGDREPPAVRTAAIAAAAVAVDGHAIVVADAGRLVPLDAPAVFGRTLRAFLAEREIGTALRD